MARPGNVRMLGGGRGACALRSRVRAEWRFLSWLALIFEEAYPRELDQIGAGRAERGEERAYFVCIPEWHDWSTTSRETSELELAQRGVQGASGSRGTGPVCTSCGCRFMLSFESGRLDVWRLGVVVRDGAVREGQSVASSIFSSIFRIKRSQEFSPPC